MIIKKLLILVLLLFSLVACEKTNGDYISFIVTKNERGGTFIHSFKYDLRTGEVEEMAKITYSSQYPLAVYDESDNTVYYSKREGESHSDQLWMHDVINNIDQRLTDDIYAINYIIPRGDSLYLVAAPQGRKVILNLFIYDKVSKTLENISPDTSFNIKYAYYDSKSDKLLISGFDGEEQWRRISEQSDENPYWPCKNDVYLVENSQFTYLFSTSEHDMDMLLKHDEEVIYSVNEIEGTYSLYPTNSVVFSYNLVDKTQSLTELPSSGSDKSISTIVYYTDDELYYIGSDDRNKAMLVYVNLKTKKEKVIYEVAQGIEATINSAQMISYKD